MDNNEYEQQYKKEVIGFFNSRTSYDNDYTIRRAIPLLKLIQLQEGQTILDLATGTGIIAIAAAQIIGYSGKVIAVDFSSGMLAQAQQKMEALNLQNIELIEADVDYIDFPDESFDVILCSTAIVYFKDIPSAIRKWHSWLKPGGVVGFSCCSENSCEAPLIITVCAKHGILLSNINEPTGSIEKCHNLLAEAGFQDIEVKTQQLGFYRSLAQAREWNGGWFHPRENTLSKLSSEHMAGLKAEYRQQIESLVTEQGVWYENMTFFVTGRKK
ncbi:MAG: methyltransferase domain-containing protein [Mojavia pulchra JT2-VF2]|jgi:protein-L-isoaspartate(D-aspartate) O-methyltransferase|uniref:Methyltransferase domain-containing protein n=1 Tax=Mojavia pulchra JT2-VF2 TaxID=287848 RepID=A0A951PXN8_9NOST|nr:methyltransferase domain-containing protein [Mojavia pulchra JT2-VF2]